MRSQTLTLAVALTIIFVAVGDAFLPQPLAKASYQTRTQVNEFLLSLFPNTDFNKIDKDHFKELKNQH
jgi:hypothetical protein